MGPRGEETPDDYQIGLLYNLVSGNPRERDMVA